MRELTPSERARFHARQLRRMVPRLRFGLYAGALLFLALAVWDELAVPGAWRRSLPLRIVTAFSLVVLARLLRLEKFRLNPTPMLYASVLIGTSAVLVLTSWLPAAHHTAAESLTLLLMLVALLAPPPRVAAIAAGMVLPVADGLAVLLGVGSFSIVAINVFAGSAVIVVVLMARLNHAVEARAFRLELELEELATRDALTGALNRRAFTESGEKALSRARFAGTPVALVLLDLDHFKKVNDTRGHAAGDEALKTVIRVMKDELRPEDAVGRLGGEELAALVVGASRDAASQVAERLRAAIEAAEITCDGQRFHVTTSMGVAMASDDQAVTLGELMKRADAALYEAKGGGRNRVVFAAA